MYIYKLIFENGSIYVGKTTGSIETRFSKHCARMESGNHHSKKLQKVYNTCKTFPKIELLEEVFYKDINTREIYWIKELDSYHNGLNGTLGGEGPASGENNHQAKYTLDDYKAVVAFLSDTDMSLQEISKELNVSIKVVEHISCGESHQYLKELMPVEYANMINKKGTRSYTRVFTYPKLINNNGIVHTVDNLHKFASTHGLDASTLSKLYNGKAKSHKGWKVYNE